MLHGAASCPLDVKVFFLSLFRNYVFQKRYVKFDGRNLMYFGSEKVRRSLTFTCSWVLEVLRFCFCASRTPTLKE